MIPNKIFPFVVEVQSSKSGILKVIRASDVNIDFFSFPEEFSLFYNKELERGEKIWLELHCSQIYYGNALQTTISIYDEDGEKELKFKV